MKSQLWPCHHVEFEFVMRWAVALLLFDDKQVWRKANRERFQVSRPSGMVYIDHRLAGGWHFPNMESWVAKQCEGLFCFDVVSLVVSLPG
jgi:hypothetical protein